MGRSARGAHWPLCAGDDLMELRAVPDHGVALPVGAAEAGGARGCIQRWKVSMMIMCPPQQGHCELATLDGFAPHVIASLYSGENRVISWTENLEHHLEGLHLTRCEE